MAFLVIQSRPPRPQASWQDKFAHRTLLTVLAPTLMCGAACVGGTASGMPLDGGQATTQTASTPPPRPPVRFLPEDEPPMDIEALNLFDTDGDGVNDGNDNCPSDSNSGQSDADGDGFGDVCEPRPLPVDTATTLNANPSPARVGQPLTLTMTVRNTGSEMALSVAASIPLPGQLDFVSLTSSQGTCTHRRESSILCQLGNLPTGETLTVTVQCTPRRPGSMAVKALALTDALDHDANSSNDTPSLTLTVLP